MDLILWRHAEAEDSYPDMSRKLTKKGVDQANRMANWLKSKLPENTLVIASPALRTQQTASALTSNFMTNIEIGPGASFSNILTAANWPYSQRPVLIVGHQPTLGEVASHLIPVIPPELSIKKGSVWWIKSKKEGEEIESLLHTVIYPEMV